MKFTGEYVGSRYGMIVFGQLKFQKTIVRCIDLIEDLRQFDVVPRDTIGSLQICGCFIKDTFRVFKGPIVIYLPLIFQKFRNVLNTVQTTSMCTW